MPDLDTAAWYALGIPFYVLYVGAEILLARLRRERVFSFAETISNLSAGLGTLVIGLFVGPFVLRAWDFTHDHVAPFPWPDHAWWKLPAALLVSDFCYYIYHRAGHRFAILWSIHGIHHQHEHVNSSVGFRLEWLADPYAAMFFGLMPLCGIDSTTGFTAIMILSAYALTAHSPTLSRRSLGFMVTPVIHGSHHSRDARFSEKNYGAMFGFWDRLFGTWSEPEKNDVLASDAPSICRTHNGVTTQWGLIMELLHDVRAQSGVREKLRLLFSRPIVKGPKNPPRDDAELSRALCTHVLIQFISVAAFGAWLLVLREERPLAMKISGALIIVLGLYAEGALLDGRAHAVLVERARLVVTALASIVLFKYANAVAIGLLTMSIVGLVTSRSFLRVVIDVGAAGAVGVVERQRRGGRVEG